MSGMEIDSRLAMGMPDEDSAMWTPMERLIVLRSLPAFDQLTPEGLMYMAQRCVERRFDKGTQIFDPEQPVGSVHLVFEGVVRIWQEGRHLLDADAPGGIGFQPVLSRSAVGQRAVALTDVRSFEIDRATLLELMEDDFDFLATGIRQSSFALAEAQRKLEAIGQLQRSEPEDVPYPEEPLDLIQRLERLRGGPFGDVNLEAILHLARSQREVRYEPGEVLWREGDASSWSVNVVYGVVSCESDERTFRMGPRSVIGIIEAHAAEPRSYTATAETRVVAIRTEASDFFDVLEDNFSLAIGFLEFVNRQLLGLSVRLAEANEGSAAARFERPPL